MSSFRKQKSASLSSAHNEQSNKAREQIAALRKQARNSDLSFDDLTFNDEENKQLHAQDNLRVMSLTVTKLYADTQVRKEFIESDIIELAASIKTQGLLQPVVVFPKDDDGRYKIFAGERRWRAVSYLATTYPYENHQIKAIINPALAYISPEKIIIGQLIENELRNNLTEIELATAIKQLKESNMSVADICKEIGWVTKAGEPKRTEIYRRLSYFDLPDNGKALVDSKVINDLSTMYALQKLSELDMDGFNDLVVKAEAEQGISRTLVETRLQQAQSRSSTPATKYRQPEERTNEEHDSAVTNHPQEASTTQASAHQDTDQHALTQDDSTLERQDDGAQPEHAQRDSNAPQGVHKVATASQQSVEKGSLSKVIVDGLVDLSAVLEVQISFNRRDGILELSKKTNSDSHIWVRLFSDNPDDNDLLIAAEISAIQLRAIKYKRNAKVELKKMPMQDKE